MRALLKTEETVGFTLVDDYEIPEPKDDEVQIKVTSVSICGSDINVWKWNDTAKFTLNDNHGVPFVPGHEAVGHVIKPGKGTSLKVGDRVAVENHFYCDNCYMCDEKRGDICVKMHQYGFVFKKYQVQSKYIF